MAFASSDSNRGPQPSLSIVGADLATEKTMLSNIPIGTLKSGDVAFLSHGVANHDAPANTDKPYWMFLSDCAGAAAATILLADGTSNATAGRWVQLAITFA